MLAAGYGNVSDFEVFFLITSLVGFVFSVYNSYSLSQDMQYLKAAKRNRNYDAGYLLTKASLFNEAGRGFLQLTFIYIAILSMTIPDPPAAQGFHHQAENAIARWAFLISAIWVCAKTAYTWYIRRQVQELNGNAFKTEPANEEDYAKERHP